MCRPRRTSSSTCVAVNLAWIGLEDCPGHVRQPGCSAKSTTSEVVITFGQASPRAVRIRSRDLVAEFGSKFAATRGRPRCANASSGSAGRRHETQHRLRGEVLAFHCHARDTTPCFDLYGHPRLDDRSRNRWGYRSGGLLRRDPGTPPTAHTSLQFDPDNPFDRQLAGAQQYVAVPGGVVGVGPVNEQAWLRLRIRIKRRRVAAEDMSPRFVSLNLVEESHRHPSGRLAVFRSFGPTPRA